jgi:hypothetical protein
MGEVELVSGAPPGMLATTASTDHGACAVAAVRSPGATEGQ